MNKQQIDEFLRLDMNISNEFDEIRNNGNKQFRLKNEILKLGHDSEKKGKKIIELKKQQYRLKGRTFIELEEELYKQKEKK